MTPDKQKTPLEAVTAQSLRSHFESCPNAAEFREEKKKRATQQGVLFGAENLERLIANARRKSHG